MRIFSLKQMSSYVNIQTFTTNLSSTTDCISMLLNFCCITNVPINGPRLSLVCYVHTVHIWGHYGR